MEKGKTQTVLAGGVYAALATPRRANSVEVDTGALLDYLDAIVATGVEGLVLFGSTGEFVHLELEERMRVAALAIKRSRVPVLVNVSYSALAGSIRLAENAAEAGASGMLLMPPYFYSYGEGQIFEFYRQFVSATRGQIPTYIYNLPMCTDPITVQLAERLLGTGCFSGIKDSSGDRSYFESLRALRAKMRFQWLVGSEALFLEARKAGADGTISGVAAAVPELMVALNNSRAKDLDRGRLNGRLLEFVTYVNRFPATVIIRQAAMLRGWPLEESAVPFDHDMAADLISFHAWFRDWLPAVLSECARAKKSPAEIAGSKRED